MKHSDTTIHVSSQIRAKELFRGYPGQDGAIYGNLLFRFNADGTCRVHSLPGGGQVSAFTLDKAEVICPHSNAVCFGTERWEKTDEFPLLYSNIYNNYSSAEDRLVGVCCVYRLMRQGDGFATTLVQVIRVGFAEEGTLWKSRPGRGDVRPYGNFVIDVPRRRLLAFTMRDEEKVTRLFEFDIPSAKAGVYSEKWGVPVFTLNPEDICAQFDYEYSNYLQGACCYDGLLYSVEGFHANSPDGANMPMLRVIDTVKQAQIAEIALFSAGLAIEPELIDFMDDTLVYMDASGSACILEFV